MTLQLKNEITALSIRQRKLRRELQDLQAEANWHGPTWASEHRIAELMAFLADIEAQLEAQIEALDQALDR